MVLLAVIVPSEDWVTEVDADLKEISAVSNILFANVDSCEKGVHAMGK